MKIAFLTETRQQGKWPINFPNARTEVAWQIALSADHFYIRNWKSVANYDYVIIIFPKGGVFLNSAGTTLINSENEYQDVFSSTIVTDLKQTNKKVCSMQEGPTWYSNDFNLVDQFNFYNQLSECDILFSHNLYDVNWYRGLFPNKQVEVMPTLMIEETISSLNEPISKENVIIGGNFSRWYGGFQSFLISDEFNCPKFIQTSHSSRVGEDQIPNLTKLPRMVWTDWMKTLSTFKYAVHLMPTIAAGTFSLNCAYFGIPCIGNQSVDTQFKCFPKLSVYAEDVYNARNFAKRLYTDSLFYKEVSEVAKTNYKKYFSKEKYLEHMNKILK